MSAEASLDDKFATNRTLSIPAVEEIPEVPAGYQPTEVELRASRLKKVAKSLEAELQDALEECGALGSKVGELLGELAPSGEKASALAKELAQVQAALSRAWLLVGYLEERKAILLSDGRGYIDLVKREYDHLIDRKPGLASSFQETVQFSKSISQAISEGRAEAKRRRAEDGEAK